MVDFFGREVLFWLDVDKKYKLRQVYEILFVQLHNCCPIYTNEMTEENLNNYFTYMEPKRRIEKMDSVIRSGKMSNNNFYFLLSMDWRGNYRRRFVVNPVV